MRELAVLIPAYNGGARLRESVESCARASLDPERYSIFVIDNCSSDGSVDKLPTLDANGVPVRIYRNERNLGRVGNWNRGLEIAGQEGFPFVTFLFVGDTWVPGSAVEELLDLMKQSGAVLGMAPLSIQAEDGQSSREGARISIPGKQALVDSHDLLHLIVKTGRLPFAPLQANIYRLFPDCPLRFDVDPKNSLNTDIESTVHYLLEHRGKVAIVSKPFLVWRESSQRFFALQDPWVVMQKTRASLRRVGETTGVGVDWRSANAVSLLTSAYELSRKLTPIRRLAFVWKVFLYLKRVKGGVSLSRVFQFTLNKVLRRQSYLSLSRDYTAANTASNTARVASRYSL